MSDDAARLRFGVMEQLFYFFDRSQTAGVGVAGPTVDGAQSFKIFLVR